MDIRARIKDQVDALIQQGHAATPRHLQVPLPGGHLEVQLNECQALGCAMWQIAVCTGNTAQASPAQLQAAGEALVQRVRYLLEPLQVHEVDQEQAAVQLRSSPPHREARTVRYFEVTAERDGGWRLARYEKSPDQPRRQIAALLTNEVLQRLCQDVVDVALR